MEGEGEGYEWKGKKERKKKLVRVRSGGGHYDLVFNSADKLLCGRQRLLWLFSSYSPPPHPLPPTAIHYVSLPATPTPTRPPSIFSLSPRS